MKTETSNSDEVNETAEEVALIDSPLMESSDAESHADDGFVSLDERLIVLTRLVNAIRYAVIGLVAFAVGILLIWKAPFPWQLIVPITWLGIAGMAALSVFWWPVWAYHRWSYRLGEQVFELQHGVIWHLNVAIPLSRLQHVDLHSGPLERRWGLASLELHTAGTRDASHRIEGLDVEVASALRDQLIAVANRAANERTSE